MSDVNETLNKLQLLIDDFTSNHKITTKGTTKFVIDGKIVEKINLFKTYIETDLKLFKKHGLLDDFISWDGQEKADIADRVTNAVARSLTKELSDKIGSAALPDSNVTLHDYEMFIDVVTNNEILVHRKTGDISQLHPRIWDRLLSKEEKALLPPKIGYLTFDPYQIEPYVMSELDGSQVLQLNLYIPPKWMLEEGTHKRISLTPDEVEDLECPEEIMDFMSHLFPEEKCRDFVFSWMHFALVSRSETYLVLNGKKGAGKGVFCDVLLSNLVGENNYRLAPESILDSIFNSSLDKTRMLVMDEIKVNTISHLNRLKKYINSKQNIEKKGIDADKVVETFSSNVISNNSIMDMLLEWDERRFSVPEITEIPLLSIWDQDEIDEFVAAMKDPIVQKQFGFWILHKAKKENATAFSLWKGDRFNTIVYFSLAEWKKTIVDVILSRQEESISVKELKKDYKNRVESTNSRFPAKMKRIESFLEDYLHEGKYNLGKLVFDKDDGEYHIIPSEHYMPGNFEPRVNYKVDAVKPNFSGLL